MKTTTAKQIIENDWFKTASREEMILALHHLEREAIQEFSNILANDLTERKREFIEDSFKESLPEGEAK